MSAGTTGGRAPLLRVEHLSVEVPTERGYVQLLDDVTFDIAPGEFVGLAGESGSGKTVTALAIMRLFHDDKVRINGSIDFDGRRLLEMDKATFRRIRGKEIGMVFQEPMASLHEGWSVGEQIAEAIREHEGMSRKAAWTRAVEMLERVGIPDPAARAKQYSFQLSGGMQQRVMIAIALACSPRLLIADEPTTALDVTIQAQIVELITDLQAQSDMAVLFVTHDLALLAGLAERIIGMYGGQIVEISTTDEILMHPRHPYLEALINAAPRPEFKNTALRTIPGAPPHPRRLPRGCRFHPRCDYATERCGSELVPLEILAPGQAVRCLRYAELDLYAGTETRS